MTENEIKKLDKKRLFQKFVIDLKLKYAQNIKYLDSDIKLLMAEIYRRIKDD